MPARTPKQCDDLFAHHIQAGNVDAVVALYEPKACLVLESGMVARGTKAIRRAISMFAAMKPRFKMNVARVVKAGDDLAVLYNDWQLKGTRSDGTPFSARGGATEIVRRQRDGTWRFVVDDPRARG